MKNGRKLFVKQERLNRDKKTSGEFLKEWQIHELFKKFPELHHFCSSLSKVLYFDADNSIIVFNYLTNYRDVIDLYVKDNIFSIAIATSIGAILATIQCQNLNSLPYLIIFSYTQTLMQLIDSVPSQLAASVPDRVLDSLILLKILPTMFRSSPIFVLPTQLTNFLKFLLR